MATVSLKVTCFLQQSNKPSHQKYKFLSFPSEKRSIVSTKSLPRPMASRTICSAIGISETFTRLKRQGKESKKHSHHQYKFLGFPTKKKRFIVPMASLTSTISVSETFTRLKGQGKVALIPYITAGDPDLRTTAEAMKVLDSCGSDIIELGIPSSDPYLDGAVLQAADGRALAGGTDLDRIVSMLNGVVPQLCCPVVLFSYYNQIHKLGIKKFMSAIKDVAHGLLVPDALLEETELLRKEAIKNKIELILLTTPTTPTEKMKAIVEASEGFVYLVSLTGVTGCRPNVSLQVQPLLQEIKKATTKPVVVGFGLSTPEHVKQVAIWGADGVVVGSAIMKLLGEAKSPEEGLKQIEIFTKSLKAALP